MLKQGRTVLLYWISASYFMVISNRTL